MKIKLINEQITSAYGANLLRARGIKDIDGFLNPAESCLQDWRDLDNINYGVDAIHTLHNNGKIAIIVDCDVDGFTSASIIGQYLQRLYPNLKIDYYLMVRLTVSKNTGKKSPIRITNLSLYQMPDPMISSMQSIFLVVSL